MSKRVPKSKRLQLINKWLRGIEDDLYEVFPTRTEGKYIVRPRKEPLTTSTASSKMKPECLSVTKPELNTEDDPDQEITEEQPECLSETKQVNKPKPITMPKPKKQPSTEWLSETKPEYDPTINIEILNQLKLLGEEIKSKREKKEQKRMIKEVLQKQLTKPRREINYNYVEPQYNQLPNKIPEEYIDETNNKIVEERNIETNIQSEYLSETKPVSYRRRNNIFSDIL